MNPAPLLNWYPALLERDLADKPVAVRMWGYEIVLFRNSKGEIGALPDRCTHRGMRLSTGSVQHDCLVCPYHGWSYDVTGEGKSPGNERMRIAAPHFEAAVHHGVVWVKSEGAVDTLPVFQYDGYYPAYVLRRIVKAPMELLIDNLLEIEHTCTGHWLFGFDIADMMKVQLKLDRHDNGMRGRCEGPQKKIPLAAELAAGLRSGDHFVMDWDMDYAPLRVSYTFTYQNPKTGRLRATRAKEIAYFAPVSADESLLFAFYFFNKPPHLFNRLFVYPVFRRWIEYQYEMDRFLLENIADRRTDLEGYRLGRFDGPLLEFRRGMRARAGENAGVGAELEPTSLPR